ncbi:glycosyl transferases group 1-domain-containing protein [Podospora fimiseda]|uniref:Chitobiosyldiphosphodolichol beta-mannosyltransferase n=1 Tax=Podospora fimiseda TaxID=252190 RepID=A0AAN7BNU2_9PEZI|nr:glycosyl transferases group 1-domain-containing protein [Podospora fimiseda]
MAGIWGYLLVSLLGSLVVLVLTFALLRPSRYNAASSSTSKDVSVQILVLGDIGRSPRMTYHALSVAKHGGKVNLIGYLETSPHPSIFTNPSITITPLPTPPSRPNSIPFIIFAPFKVLFQIFHLTHILLYSLPPSKYLLVQNPPSIPTLAISGLACHLRNTRLIIDWHNYGWTILASTRGSTIHPFVLLSRLYEIYFGRLGWHNLTVTRAMARQLSSTPYKIKTPLTTVHDRPAAIFQPLSSSSSSESREQILTRILPNPELVPSIISGHTKLIVSSTSWTPDEDFSIFLDALTRYKSTPLLAVITGKGPQKEYYLNKITQLTNKGRLPNVRVVTAFLPFEDYAKLLACADLGICLHMSSSGVDLPMKVVDMFGAGLPVAAYNAYESFEELVKEGRNGVGFETAGDLAEVLERLLNDSGKRYLEMLRKGAVKEGSRRWDEEWDSTVGKVLGLTS